MGRSVALSACTPWPMAAASYAPVGMESARKGTSAAAFDARSLKTMADGMGPDAMTMLSMSTRIMVHSVTRSTFGMSGGVEVSGGSMFENPDVHVARGLASWCRLCTSMAPRVQPLYSFAWLGSRVKCVDVARGRAPFGHVSPS